MTTVVPARAQLRRRTSARSAHSNRAIGIVVLSAAALLVLVPFLWMISLAFTPEAQAFATVSLIPKNPTFENFQTALVDAHLLRALLNSAIVAIVVVLMNCVVAVLAGYAFAMLPFPGSNVVFVGLVASVAVPVSVTLIPLFLMARAIPLAGGNDLFGHGGSGLLDSLAGLMLPYLVMPMNVFLARQYFLSAPVELAEAGRLDGANEVRIFSRIYLPLARPLVAVVAVFSFVGVWDDFLWPLVITQSPQTQTVQLALAQFLASGNIKYGPLMAGAFLATVPVLVLFLFNQRSFISGLAEGSVKG